MKRVCTESYFRTDYSAGFFKDMLIFKKQSNIDSLKIFFRFALPFRLIVPSEKPNIGLNDM